MPPPLFRRFDFRVTFGYAVVALLWIVFSDQLLSFITFGDEALLVAVSTVKGVAFVLVSALALFAVLNYELRKRDQVEHILDEDIQERTKTLETLRKSEQRFATGSVTCDDLLRARATWRAQEGRLPDPRLPHRGAQEVRPCESAQVLPVLEALIASFKFYGICEIQKGAFERPFLLSSRCC